MTRIYLLALFAMLFSTYLSGQNIIYKAPAEEAVNRASNSGVDNHINSRDNVFILSIAINDFDDRKNFGPLSSVENAINYIEPLEETFNKNYHSKSFQYSYRNEKDNTISGFLTKEEADGLLKSWVDSVRKINTVNSSNTVAILYLSSHGVIEIRDSTETYFFVTSDTKRNDLASTAISGKDICSYVNYLANAGCYVIVFVDTCQAEGIFGSNYSEIQLDNKIGGVAVIPACASDDFSYEVDKRALFATSLNYCLNGRDKQLNGHDGQILLEGLGYAIITNMHKDASNNGVITKEVTTYINGIDNDFCILKKYKEDRIPYDWSSWNPFQPIPNLSNYSVEYRDKNASAKTLSTMLYITEGISTVIIGVGAVRLYQNSSCIKDYDSKGLNSNSYRKNARIDCWLIYSGLASLGIEYFCRHLVVKHQNNLRYKAEKYSPIEGKQSSKNYSVTIYPSIDLNSYGVGFAINF